MVDKIKFGLLSPEEIRKMSAARIITADTYDEDGHLIFVSKAGRIPHPVGVDGSAIRNDRTRTALPDLR